MSKLAPKAASTGYFEVHNVLKGQAGRLDVLLAQISDMFDHCPFTILELQKVFQCRLDRTFVGIRRVRSHVCKRANNRLYQRASISSFFLQFNEFSRQQVRNRSEFTYFVRPSPKQKLRRNLFKQTYLFIRHFSVNYLLEIDNPFRSSAGTNNQRTQIPIKHKGIFSKLDGHKLSVAICLATIDMHHCKYGDKRCHDRKQPCNQVLVIFDKPKPTMVGSRRDNRSDKKPSYRIQKYKEKYQFWGFILQLLNSCSKFFATIRYRPALSTNDRATVQWRLS